MTIIRVKGYEIDAITIKDSFNRRATQIQNNIIKLIERLGVIADDVIIELEPNCMKNAPAKVSWYFSDHRLHYSYILRPKYVENLYVVYKVLELEINALIEEKKSLSDFLLEFSEDQDVDKKRKDARETLGLSHNENDIKIIDKAYKDLAKAHHPDTEGGNLEKFKEINHAHKILKRELT